MSYASVPQPAQQPSSRLSPFCQNLFCIVDSKPEEPSVPGVALPVLRLGVGIIIFLNILASPLQPDMETGMQLALITVDSLPTCCPLGTPCPISTEILFLSMQSLAYTEAWFLMSQVQNFEFAFAKLHEDFVGPFVQPIKVSLKGSPVLSISSYVFAPACRGAFWSVTLITDDVIKQHQSFIVIWGTLFLKSGCLDFSLLTPTFSAWWFSQFSTQPVHISLTSQQGCYE